MNSNSSWRRRKNWSPERRAKNNCKWKVSYPTWVDARQAIDSMVSAGKAGRGEMNAYSCEVCGGYHVGSRRKLEERYGGSQ